MILRRRRSAPLLVLLALFLPRAAPLWAQEAAPALVDRVVATVDGDPILASDLERTIGLGLVESRAGESDAALRRRALDAIVEQRLRLHEIDRFGFEEAPLDQVDAQFEHLRSRFPTEAAFRAELARLGLEEAGLRQLLARQISVLTYVEERLGPRVFVSVDDIRKRYDEVLVPELRQRGQPAPPLDEVREDLREVLRSERLNQEIDRWTAELRAKADVVDLLDRDRKELPPLAKDSRE